MVSLQTAPSCTPQCPLRIMPSNTTRATQEAARRRQGDEAMAAAILQKEKDAAKNDGLKAANEDNLHVAVDMNPPHVPLHLVVSPPCAPNLTSLLTGHIGQEVGKQAADNGIATDRAATHRRTNRSMTMRNLPKRRN